MRSTLLFNEKIGRILYHDQQLTARPEDPPTGTPIRVNGDLGLTETRPSASLHVAAPEGLNQRFPLAFLRELPQTRTTTQFHCIEGWTEVMSYSGVRFSDFLARLPLRQRYAYVGFETADRGYYVSLDMESMLHPQTLLAFEMNGVPLSAAHGAPLRLLIPIKYGIKSLKRIERLFFSQLRPPDYWAERGYDWYAGL